MESTTKNLEKLDLGKDENSSSNGSLKTAGTSAGGVVYAEGSGPFTLEMARNLTGPTSQLHCNLKDNDVIRFGEYIVRDYDTKTPLLHVPEEHNKM